MVFLCRIEINNSPDLPFEHEVTPGVDYEFISNYMSAYMGDGHDY